MPGILLILMGLFVGIISDVFHRVPNKKTVTGEIVSIESERAPDRGKTMYAAYVEYYVNGMPYTVKSKFKSSSFYTGQTMRVAYNKAAPEHAAVRPRVTVYAVMLGFILAGLAVCCRSL